MFLKFSVDLLEPGLRLLLLSKQQDLIVTGVKLRDGTVHITKGVLLRLELSLADAHHAPADQDTERDDQECHQRHPWIDGDHHGHGKDQCQYSGHHLGKALLQGIGHSLHIIGHPAQHITEGLVVKIPDWKAAYLVLYCAPEIMHGALDRVGQAERPYNLGKGFCQVDRKQYKQDIADHIEVDVCPCHPGSHIRKIGCQPAGDHALDPGSGGDGCHTCHRHQDGGYERNPVGG